MEFWAALCVAAGAAIGSLAFCYALLKLLIVYEFRRRPSPHEANDIRWARWISEIREPAVPAVDERKTYAACITDPPGQIVMARAARPDADADADAWVIVVQPSESERA